MKIFSAQKMRALDAETILRESIQSVDLMERAGQALVDFIMHSKSQDLDSIAIFCGPGNNGGDGLVMARIFGLLSLEVEVYYYMDVAKSSEDFQFNFARLKNEKKSQINISQIGKEEMPDIPENTLVIDAIFGTGLKRNIDDSPWTEWIDYINELPNEVLSIDMPSGLFADQTTLGNVVEADITLSLELPKLAFFCPENERFVGDWHIVPIQLDHQFKAHANTPFETNTLDDISELHQARNRFAHKGIFGHAIIGAGSHGKMGAAVLAGRGALRSGVGKLTMHIPLGGLQILQTALPEAMVVCDDHSSSITSMKDISHYEAIGIGCGIGVSEMTKAGVKNILELGQPLVIDADGLNIISADNTLVNIIPAHSILTPHLGEFERLFGHFDNHFDRLEAGRKMANELNVYIILKGANTAIFTPEMDVYFNTSGNPGMATAGSGDVLAGVITGLLAQNYSPLEASCIGVYVHGLAGDIAVEKMGHESLIASDIVDHLGPAFQKIKLHS